MCHVEIDTENRIAEYIMLPVWHPVRIAVAGNLMEANMGIFLRHSSSVVEIVAQMNHRIRLHTVDAPPHKTKARMGVGQDQNFHSVLFLLAVYKFTISQPEGNFYSHG
jgi:hypothetical protein